MRETLPPRGSGSSSDPADQDEPDDDETSDRLFGIDSSLLLKSYLPSTVATGKESQLASFRQPNVRHQPSAAPTPLHRAPSLVAATPRQSFFEAVLRNKLRKSSNEVLPSTLDARVEASPQGADEAPKKPRPASTGACGTNRSARKSSQGITRQPLAMATSPSGDITPSLGGVRMQQFMVLPTGGPPNQRLAEKIESIEAYMRENDMRRMQSLLTPRKSRHSKFDHLFNLRESQCPSPVAHPRPNKPPVIQLAMWGAESRTPVRSNLNKDMLVPKAP
ncbi:hypothetical protein SPRG_19460, partial [Saprolegnia parasitica CBS 223.65]